MSGLRAHAGLLLQAAAAGGALTWNPSDKSAYVSLSGGNLIVSASGGNPSTGGVRGTVGYSNPGTPRQFEVVATTSSNQVIGVGRAAAAIDWYPGYDAESWSYYSAAQKYTNSTPTSFGATWTVGDVIGLLLDGTDLYAYKNGTLQGLMFSGLTGVLYPMWGPGSSGAGSYVGTLNSTLAYPVGGAVAW